MSAPLLAPRRGVTVAPVPSPDRILTHSDAEWAAVHHEILRLYVRERRKLRYVMQYMEREYGFCATAQMYKKRFAKWGFQKNSRRSTDTDRAESVTASRGVTPKPGQPILACMPMPLKLVEDDRTTLMILFNVKSWTASFFESMQAKSSDTEPPKLPPESQLRQLKTKEANFAFKLVIDLLDRGHGALAGRMARKAFLLAEDLLRLEGPALMWNLLEMMHYTVTGHAVLFRILLGHLIALAKASMPGAHPFIDMLRGMQELVARLGSDRTPDGSPPPISSSSSSPGDESGCSSVLMDHKLQSSSLPIIVRQAWTINAEMLLGNFDPRLFPLYFRILFPTWDDCPVPAPARLVHAAKQWFCTMETKHLIDSAPVEQVTGHHAARLAAYGLPEEDATLDSLLTPLTKGLMGDSAQVYQLLRKSSLAALREGRMGIDGAKLKMLNINSTISVRMLAVLATAKIYESAALSDDGDSTPLDPRPVISAIRTLIDQDRKYGSAVSKSGTDAVERMRAIVTLRGYAEGETDPQVVREMWMLQDALTAAGRQDEAREVERDAYRRMEKYIEHIPVDSA